MTKLTPALVSVNSERDVGGRIDPAAGRMALRQSPEFQRLRASLGIFVADDCASHKCDRTATDL